MRRILPSIFSLALCLGPTVLVAASARAQARTAAAPQDAATPIDWNRLRDETVQVLAEYLRINTTNPPGNELQAARFLKRILDREGIPAQILDTAELRPSGRANLYARLRGNGSKQAIALVHHMDVVPATASYWSVDPFAGIIKDGYVWGRGALDMKGEGIAHLMAMIALKRSGVTLDRDIVFIANADEELGSTGAEVFVKRHPDLLADVEFLLTEGGDNQVERGALQYYGVGVAEKRTFWQHVVVHGVASHGARPTKQNPVPRLVAALDRIARYETPLHLTPGVEKYFHDISRLYPGEQRAWLGDVKTALRDPRARDWILSDVYWNAILRNTISLTGLQGSNKTNVIPPEASADLDIRLLPDQDPRAMRATLQRIVADTAVHFSDELTPRPPLESPVATDLFRAIERAAHDRDPAAFVTTPMLTGATDRPTYRKLGIITYGFDPFRVEAADAQRGVHGNDERLSVENVGFGVHFLYDVLRYVGGAPVVP
ncbi:MAG TPA: M20/M25/M40 family metallo-hydrolase [Gemmatimonadaceae bacterium]|nr:M20/M25/M40 family metallo-hydrolase [Gemmatimonadaceae bacterium]